MFRRQLCSAPGAVARAMGGRVAMRSFQTIRPRPTALYAHEDEQNPEYTKISFSKDPKAVSMGTLKIPISAIDDPIRPDKFEANRQFMPILQKTIGKSVDKCPTYSLLAQAEGREATFFNIYDLRNPPAQARIAEVDDTIGHVQVQEGVITPGTYEPNSMYRLYSTDGFIQLSDYLHKQVQEECERSQ